MRPKGPNVQKCAVSSGILANVKFLGGGGGRVQRAGTLSHRMAHSANGIGLAAGGIGFLVCGLVSSFGGLEFSVGGIDFSVGGFRKSIGGFETPWPYPCAGRAIQYANYPPKKCFNPSASLCLTLSISHKEAEGSEKRTLQPLSA